MSDPLVQVVVTVIRRAVLHGRALSSLQIVERLRPVLPRLDADTVELALLDAPGVVRTSSGR